MSTNFDSNTPMPESVFEAQNEDVKTARNTLEAMIEDLANETEWTKEHVETTIELLEAWKGVR